MSRSASASGSWAGSGAGGLGSVLFFEPFAQQAATLTQVELSLSLTLLADVTDVNPFQFEFWADPNLFMTTQASSLSDTPLNFYAFGDPVSGQSAEILLAPGEAVTRQHRLTDSLDWTFTAVADLEYFLTHVPVGFHMGTSLFSLSSYGGANATLQLGGEITYHFETLPRAASAVQFLVPEAGGSALLLAFSAGALGWLVRRKNSI